MPLFFIIFVLIPLAEISVFIAVGDEVGLLNTLLLCLLTAMTGGVVVRLQGFETLMKGQNALRQGFLPMEELFDGFCIVIAGAMLITPGFVTDILGFSLLIPPFRTYLRRTLSKRMEFHGHNNWPNRGDDIVEGEFKRLDPDDNKD